MTVSIVHFADCLADAQAWMCRYGLSYFYMRSAPSEMLKRYKRLYDIQVTDPGRPHFGLDFGS